MNESQIPWRVQLWFVAACYGAVLALAAVVVATRYLAGLRNPDDFNGGMAAFGDWMMAIFLVGLLLIPTWLLAFVIRKREEIAARFAKILFGFSLLAPLSLGLTLIPVIGQKDTILGSFCLYRLSGEPMVIAGLIGCRLLARFKLAKRLLSWAVVIETATVVLLVAGLFFFSRAGRG